MKVSVVIPVYRDAARAIQALRAVVAQRLEDGRAQVVIVDDGSGDDDVAHLRRECDGFATVLALPLNQGRAAARNAGARAATGEALLFLDCDCQPLGDGFLAGHVAALDAGAIASAGPVEGTGSGFWHRYQLSASERRAAHARAGRSFAGSTQNLMVRRAAFEAVGGFDQSFRGYGFEDRDLLLRLAALGPVAWTGASRVSHLDALTLPAVCRKMREAGGAGSGLFAARHPGAYAALGYDAIDARRHRWLRPLAWLAAPVLPGAIALTQAMLESRAIPYALRAAAVRLLSAASFLCGTSRSLAVKPH